MKSQRLRSVCVGLLGTQTPRLEEYSFQIALFLILILCASNAYGQVLSPDRAFYHTWRNAGYSNNIVPGASISVTDYGALGDGVTDDTQAIRAAIADIENTSELGTLYFPAGDYLITSTIHLPSNTCITGELNDSEIMVRLLFDFDGSDGDCFYIGGSVSGSFQPMDPQSMYSNWFEVTDGSQFAVGDYIEIRQDNDPSWDNGDAWAAQAVGQIEQIISINQDTITIADELRADYEAIYNPVVRKISPKTHTGIDNLIIERIDASSPVYGDHIHFHLASECWVRGVELTHCVQRLIHITSSSHISVTGCYLHHAFGYGGGGHAYGVECSSQAGSCLVQDNIFIHLRHSLLIQNGGNGNVFGYNYSSDSYRDEWPHDYGSDIAFHGNRGFANLVEGNIVGNLIFDGSHGEPAGPYNTAFRNQADLYGVMITSSCSLQNIIGNDITHGFMGQYSLAGQDHFEWGNREAGMFGGYSTLPAGTTDLPDVSYYLSENIFSTESPDFWVISQSLPTTGTGSSGSFGQTTNPARVRYFSGSTFTVPAPSCQRHGDVNGSGSVTARDVQLAFFAVLELEVLNAEQECAADCDGNGVITANDCSRLFNYILIGTPCSN